ncbi:hypothetical protein GC093_17345 [Paenibacillus sp. LMG 31456]|uniref:Uncharacterized protein n=1 Tax=Paenibacillus foliorum TaxID=2654974 RepID=A0A972K2I8_9BACL|nr:hypothetical protein [Paenibacillus foliorum]
MRKLWKGVSEGLLKNGRFYIIYNELSITICSELDDVCEELAQGGMLYSYADDEELAHSMMMECFHFLTSKNL